MRNLHKGIVVFVLLLLLGCTREDRVWIPGWRETTPLDIPRAGAAVVVSKDTMYVIGGVDGNNFLDTTLYAKIHEDGSLGPWKPGQRLNEERGFIDAAIYKDSIYVVGGGNGPYGEHLLSSVERARIPTDGSPGPWEKEGHQMVIPRRCSKVVVFGNTLYSFGGFGGALLDNVERAAFMEDGSSGEWQLEKETMTVPRYVNGIKKWKDAVYVIGGHDQNKGVGIPDVEWNRFAGGGKKNLPWKATSPLKIGRYGSATAAHGGYLYTLGGISGAEYLESVEKSRIESSGELGPWEMTTPLPQTRATFSAVVYRDRIYLLGGANRNGYFTEVSYATFNDQGDIGYWGTKAGAEAHRARMEEAKLRSKELPNEGVVLEVIQASAYSYIRVKGEGGISWLAGPKTGLKTGAHIRYSEGVYMSNFYSKELKRSFPSILFVGTIQQVNIM